MTPYTSGFSPIMAVALAALGVFDLAGAAALGMQFLHKEDAEQELRADWRPPAMAKSNAVTAKPSGGDVQTLTRPIFSKTRKAYVGAQSAAPSAPTPVAATAGLTLSALASYNNVQRAFVVSASAPKGKWCDVGEQIDGWTIVQIHSAYLTMQNGALTVKLMLYPEATE